VLKFKIFLFLFLITTCSSNNVFSKPPVIFEDSFGDKKYGFVLFDLKPDTLRCLGHNENIEPDGLLVLAAKKNGPKIEYWNPDKPFPSLNKSIRMVVPDGTPDGMKNALALYDKNRVSKTLKICHHCTQKKMEVVIVEGGGEFYDKSRNLVINMDTYPVPSLVGHDGELFHPKANLFDAFPLQVDAKMMDLGIGEWIKHETKNGNVEWQFQITIFGGIFDVQDPGLFSSLGFFQMTFSPSSDCWYHRFFRPWTMSHLMSISNSATQRVLRAALSKFLSTFENDEVNNETSNLLTTYFFTQNQGYSRHLQQLKEARQNCYDHNNPPYV
jgi:hypothetical protein